MRRGPLAALMVACAVALTPGLGWARSDTAVVADGFDSGGYEGNDGTLPFAGPWIEIGESDGPQSGDVVVDKGGSCKSGPCLEISGGDATRGVWRRADLWGATRGVLRFSLVQTGSPGEGAFVVRASADRGLTWSTLAWFTRKDHSITVSIDITRYLGPGFALAMATTPSATHTAHVDDVQIFVDYRDPPMDDFPQDEGDRNKPPDHADPQGKPHATTTTTTGAPGDPGGSDPGGSDPGGSDPGGSDPGGGDPAPPVPSGPLADDILIGIAVQHWSLTPPAWTASEEAAIRAELEAARFAAAAPGALEMRDDRAPVTDVEAAFTRPGTSVRSRFVPTAIFGALLAWATITGFERTKRRPRRPDAA